jgi:basic membrane protein A
VKARVPKSALQGILRSLLLAATFAGTWSCSPRPEDCARASIVCGALVTEFGTLDGGTSGQAWLALQDARSAGLLDRIDHIETIDTRDRAANIVTFAEQGYDVVVTVGQGSIEETLAAATTYPDLRFIGVLESTDATPVPPNFVALLFPEEKSGFLAGAAAAFLSSTGHVAAICEADFIDSVFKYCEGFRAGAAHVRPTIDAQVHYRSGSEELLFRDVKWGEATAQAAIDQGADVVFAVGEGTAEAALKAAAGRGALVIGAENDQYGVLPQVRPQLVTSAVLEIRAGLSTLLQKSLHGQAPTGAFEGEIGLAPFHEFEDRISPTIVAELDGLAANLNAGLIQVPVAH